MYLKIIVLFAMIGIQVPCGDVPSSTHQKLDGSEDIWVIAYLSHVDWLKAQISLSSLCGEKKNDNIFTNIKCIYFSLFSPLYVLQLSLTAF